MSVGLLDIKFYVNARCLVKQVIITAEVPKNSIHIQFQGMYITELALVTVIISPRMIMKFLKYWNES